MRIEIITFIVFGFSYLVFVYFIRKTETFNSFAVGNRDINGVYIFASLSATIVGPGFSLGIVSEGFNSGVLFALLGSFYGAQMILVGSYVAPRIKIKFPNAFSLGDIIAGENSHNNKILKVTSGVVSILVCIGVIGILTKAGGDVFYVLLDIPKHYGAILMTSIVILYSFSGGINASILTDFFQFIIFLILLPSLFILVVYSNNISSSEFIETVILTTKNGVKTHSTMTMFGLIVWYIFGDILQPPILNRILASKTIAISKWSFIFSGIFCFFWLLLMSLLGVSSKLASIDGAGNDNTLLLLGEEYYPPYLFGIFIIAMLGIVMSSQDSILNAGATVFTRDIMKPISHKSNISSKIQLNYSRIATVFIGVLGLSISFMVPSILDGLLFLASIWAPTMIVSIFSSIFLQKIFWQSAFISMIVGFITSIGWGFTKYYDTMPSILIGILASLSAYYFTHKTLKLKYRL